MIVKKHINDRRLILAICDTDLIGKIFKEKKLQLDLSSDFYNGDEISEFELDSLVKKAYIINAVGKTSIGSLIKNKIISKEDVKYVKNIPYAQVMFA